MLKESFKAKKEKGELDPEVLGLGSGDDVEGWHGYVEWESEKFKERKRVVREWLAGFEFPGVCPPPHTYSFSSHFHDIG